ncbi:ATP-dependent nuclease, partial [Streptomyces albogriseolus]|uniref:ATP-dependent nuclease n=1 Tax=Streptomyces albogriseolus TaxID=1887 RepID=UPI003460D144
HLPYRRKAATPAAKKSVIRSRAGHLSASLDTQRESHLFYQSERIIRPGVTLSDAQTAAISEILGREYDAIRVISHRYFDVDGATVVLKSSGLQYSEAFAGSGEFAVVMLVHAITAAPERSLILLDEPEVSLHPGAQSKLMKFLSEQAKLRRHQVVISTHSPEIIRDLPRRAIKVFQRSDTDGRVELVSQASEPSEAFFRLGVKPREKRILFVEDALGRAIVRRAIRPLGQAANAQVDIEALPGGAGAIQKVFIPNFALSNRLGCLVLVDGDQRPSAPIPEPDDIADTALEDAAQNLLGAKVPLLLNGSNGASAPGERVAQLRMILTWAHRHVDFLPGETPETLLLEMEGASAESGDGKTIWVNRTRLALGREHWESVTAAEILAEQERALARLDPECKQHERIRERVRRFLAE